MSKILRLAVFVFSGLAGLWFYFWWVSHPLVAIAGSLFVLFVFAALFALQFFTIWRVNQRDPSPQATPAQHVQAWWSEVRLAIKVFVVQQAWFEHKFKDSIQGDSGKKPLTAVSTVTNKTTETHAELFSSENFPKKQRGIVFVHGFLCNRGFWNPWLQQLQARDSPYVAISLEPVFTSIDTYTPQLEQAVSHLTACTGVPPLIICHSMGGLVARAWLRAFPSGATRVSHIVTIGTPHHGTGIVQGPSFAANATQMQRTSEWIADLAADEQASQPKPDSRNASNQDQTRESDSKIQYTSEADPLQRSKLPGHQLTKNPYELFTCYYSNCDNIVFPTLTATLEGADNRFVPGQAHVQMAFDETVMRESLARL